MTHGSLFSGIGGFDLAAELVGWDNIFHCEINQFGRQVLNYYWPKAESYEDITKTDFTIYRGKIDVLSGGFPCQPFSTAGRRKGKEDDRYLWPEMLRAIREIRPTWVVGENVAGLTSMVQPEIEEFEVGCQAGIGKEADNQTICEEQEYVIETVCSDLENLGYSVQPIIIPACATGAPHRRDRIWFIAHNNSFGSDGRATNSNIEKENEATGTSVFSGTNGPGVQQSTSDTTGDRWTGNRSRIAIKDGKPESGQSWKLARGFERFCENGNAADANSNNGRERRMHEKGKQTTKRHVGTFNSWSDGNPWRNFPTQPPICSRNDGVPSGLVGITVPKHRQESLKGYGNAIVPQVALSIFQIIDQLRREAA